MAKKPIKVRRKATSTPACWKKGTQKSDRGKHRSQKYEITEGTPATLHKSICWACASGRERTAIKAEGGGPKDA